MSYGCDFCWRSWCMVENLNVGLKETLMWGEITTKQVLMIFWLIDACCAVWNEHKSQISSISTMLYDYISHVNWITYVINSMIQLCSALLYANPEYYNVITECKYDDEQMIHYGVEFF